MKRIRKIRRRTNTMTRAKLVEAELAGEIWSSGDALLAHEWNASAWPDGTLIHSKENIFRWNKMAGWAILKVIS